MVQLKGWQRCFPVNVCGLHGKQQIQLMDAQSLPHAYLGSARATAWPKLLLNALQKLDVITQLLC